VRRLALLLVTACGTPASPKPVPPPVIDRFSVQAGHLMTRDKRPDLPAPGAPIDLDKPPFITQGLAPDGKPVRYYNFDIQPDVPAPLYTFRRGGKPIDGQLDVVDVIPGGAGYSDFWRITFVELPAGAPTITSATQLGDLQITSTDRVIDCPVIPRGTTAREAHNVSPPTEIELFYRGARITCLQFAGDLTLDHDRVPTSPIYVTFASAAKFRTEGETAQTHNVVMSLPGDTDYSPLWDVHVYDPAAFDQVHDASSAQSAPLVEHGPRVNCPIVSVQGE
jgi:hypothetical protein